jgi:RNA polymerase sigma-70 factor, ECF subfamily
MAVAVQRPRIALVCSDAELIQRTGAGDRTAFEKLYKRYARPVFGLALRRLGDRGRAEDALQETFVSVWRSARTYKPERGPGAPWLYGVARNAIVDRSRARSEPPAEAPDEASLDAGPDERAEGAWVQWRVHRALETLPEREREILRMRFEEGLTQTQIAEKIGISQMHVSRLIRKSLARMRDQLA